MVEIVGLTGPIGCGKGVLSNYLVECEWTRFIYSDVLREEAGSGDREKLIEKGNALRAEKGQGVLSELILEKIDKGNYRFVVADGIRHPKELYTLKDSDNLVHIIGVTAPQEVRYERQLQRARSGDALTWQDFVKKDEKDRAIGIDACLENCDHIIENYNKSKEDVVSELISYLNKAYKK